METRIMKTAGARKNAPMHSENSAFDWVDAQQLCELLRISRRTLDRYRTAGIFPSIRLGNRVYFNMQVVEECMNHVKN